MRFVCKTKIEKTWIVASIFIFVAHWMLQVSSHGYSEPIAFHGYSVVAALLKLWLEVTMVALSFPLGGLTLFVLQDAMFWCDGCRDLEWLLDWPTLLFAGYIQWFWLLPEFLRRRKPTFLNLNRPPETISPNASPALAETAAPASFFAATRVALDDDEPHLAFNTADFTLPLAEFDEAGLTALGRVFQAHAPLPASESSSRVETIFPRVS